MDEITEAETYCRELDEFLSGDAKTASPEGEFAKDVNFASQLSSLDRSGESRIRRSLKTRLLSKTDNRSFLRRFVDSLSPKTLGLAFSLALAIFVIVPTTLYYNTPRGMGIVVGRSGNSRSLSMFSGGSSASSGNGPVDSTGLISAKPASGSKGFVRGRNYKSDGSMDALKAAADNAAASFNRVSANGGVNDASNSALPHGAGKFGAMKSSSAGRTYDSDVALGGGAAAGGTGSTDRVSGGDQNKDGKNTGESLAFLQQKAMQEREMFPEIQQGSERYEHYAENEFFDAEDHPLSTFSIDVDAASYSNVRRFLRDNRLPPADAVRIEEMVNYFHYDYPEPAAQQPFSITAESAKSPWNPAREIVRIGVKGKTVAKEDLPASNLVFLIDSSGSMADADKLPLLKQGLRLLVDELRAKDRISIVTYAGDAGVALPATRGDRKDAILAALNGLSAGGGTNGGAGIQLAYRIASQNFVRGGSNRVILATDGDFNLGVTGDGNLESMIEKERERGVFLTVLGVGRGNTQDAMMQKLADKGNGNYAYVDDISEAQRVLVREMSSTLFTVAKDVKIQIEFNPALVKSYRLIGYEKRMLEAKDFNNDKKDAGELGAGRTVTALYEIVPVKAADAAPPAVDPLKYRKPRLDAADARNRELLTIKARYKMPDGDKSAKLYVPLRDEARPWAQASDDFRFATAVAGFGMLLRGSTNVKGFDYARVHDMAQRSVGKDEGGYRGEFIRLVDKAALLAHP